ncbi:MAG: cellulase family glycosylhydrolase [Candidatus Omnitrophica bacterium]|nr:cellulase family glycosylhydrolase [Candidatus Omnitrophota bacterium]
MYKNESDIDRALELIKELGVSIIRVDFSWNHIEKEKNIFDFQRLDCIVSACQKNNIQILGVLGYSPPWTGNNWNSPPSDVKALLNYIATTIKRYPDVKYWEFWNEPDYYIYWQPQDDMKTYTDILKSVYTTIKSANPKSYVLLGGLTSDGFYAFKNILRYGGGDYFDIANFHPFIDPFRKNNLEEIKHKLNHIRKELEKYNLHKKIWLTEIGCPGITNKAKTCSWWFGQCPNEFQQAEFLKKLYNFILAEKDVEKIFWAFFQDTSNHFKNGVDYFGLIRTDYSKKPAYHEYKKIINGWNCKNSPSIPNR